MCADKDYIEENIDVVNRAYKARDYYWNSRRFVVLKKFLEGKTKTISIGCGSYEPVILKTSYALDIAPNCEAYLKELDYQGIFVLGDCRKIPFKDKEFDAAVCSEVLEHLPTMDDVKKTIKEVARISNNWLFTTPCHPIGPLNTEPTHKRAFSLADIHTLFQNYKFTFSKDDIYFYIQYVEKK
jgi:hypothetical protein